MPKRALPPCSDSVNGCGVATSRYNSAASPATAALSRPAAPVSNRCTTAASRAPGGNCAKASATTCENAVLDKDLAPTARRSRCSGSAVHKMALSGSFGAMAASRQASRCAPSSLISGTAMPWARWGKALRTASRVASAALALGSRASAAALTARMLRYNMPPRLGLRCKLADASSAIKVRT